MGFIRRAFNVDDEDSSIVAALRQAGGIPFVKSAMPVGAAPKTSSALWGRAINPLDMTRMTGGSSGGEAGLIGSGCSPIGLGSDLAGSIRYPAAACGVSGFKASDERVNCD